MNEMRESGKLRGGKEKGLCVELPFLISCIVSQAATVFLKIPSPPSPTTTASLASLSLSASSSAGNTASIMLSHSFTSFEIRSVVKNGCSTTFLMNGKRRRHPVLLSYFFTILANPTITKLISCCTWKLEPFLFIEKKHIYYTCIINVAVVY